MTSAQCATHPDPAAGQTFQTSAALVKLTGVCEDFSDSSTEEDGGVVPPPKGSDPPTPERNDDDSPTWATTSWKSDSGFNSDAGCCTNGLDQESRDSQLQDWQEDSLDSPIIDVKDIDFTPQAPNACHNSASSHGRENPATDLGVRSESCPPVVPVLNSFHCEAEDETQSRNDVYVPSEERNERVPPAFCNDGVFPSASSDDNESEQVNPDSDRTRNSRGNQSETLDRISDRVRVPPPPIGTVAMGNHERTNPFNRIPLIDDNHFEVARVIRVAAAVDERRGEPTPPVSPSKELHSEPSPTESQGSQNITLDKDEQLMDDEFELWEQNVLEIITESLAMEEDYYSQPEGFFGYSRYEELEQAIQKYKQKVMSTPEDSEKRQGLVKKLIQLRLKLQELKDEPEGDDDDKRKKVLGHQFIVCTGLKVQPQKCDVCAASMWNRLKAGYLCKECGFSCHSKCIDIVKRHCVAAKLSKKAQYEMAICPEVGLAAQNFRCADCKASISFKYDSSEPRQCDYTGLYYCHICHWNDAAVIPARAVHNWDFIPRKICRQSKQLLDLMRNKVVVNLDSLNPGLFNRVEALTNIKKLREDILVMKLYFMSCKYAKELRLLRMLEERLHFVEGSSSYTVQDLVETHDDTLFDSVKEIHMAYSQHIRIECDLCRAKGYICELCRAEDLIFPFDIIAISCSKCSAVFHRDCFFKKKGVCPKCERLLKPEPPPDDDR